MRHAEAVEPSAWKGPDKTRPLTPAGAAALEAAVGEMRRLKLSADTVLTSPFVRAAQTAAALSESLHVLQVVQCPELSAGARLDAFASVLRRHVTDPAVWVVCHMPEICVFASRLTGDPQDLERPFRPGETVAVDCDVVDGEVVAGRQVWRRRLEDWASAKV